MGLIVNVYRSASPADYTRGGISSTHGMLCLVNVPGPFEPTAEAPAAWLESHLSGIARIVPKYEACDHRHHMAGGNYAATSDSRFSTAVEQITGQCFYGAVAIHDRVE